MSTDEAAEVFSPFYRGAEARRLQIEGAGLGLYICRRIVDGLGGSLSVACGTPKGTTFTLRVPVEVPAGHSDDASGALGDGETIRLRGRVLLVEDDPSMQTIIRYYLESAGLSVAVAQDGQKALSAVDDCDLVLMDLFMPQLNGRSTAAALRQRKCTKPIIALTAATCSLVIDSDLQIFADCVSKSAGRAGLLSVLAKYLPSPAEADAPAEIADSLGAETDGAAALSAGQTDLTRNYVQTFPGMVDGAPPGSERPGRRIVAPPRPSPDGNGRALRFPAALAARRVAAQPSGERSGLESYSSAREQDRSLCRRDRQSFHSLKSPRPRRQFAPLAGPA